jgi:transposase
MLSRWRKEYREGKLQGDHQRRVAVTKTRSTPGVGELTENARLRRENARLQQENALLKKWQRYLAERHQSDLDSSKDMAGNQASDTCVSG